MKQPPTRPMSDAALFTTIVLPGFAVIAVVVWRAAGLIPAALALCTAGVCATLRELVGRKRNES